jgi:hypothetical protein
MLTSWVGIGHLFALPVGAEASAVNSFNGCFLYGSKARGLERLHSTSTGVRGFAPRPEASHEGGRAVAQGDFLQ